MSNRLGRREASEEAQVENSTEVNRGSEGSVVSREVSVAEDAATAASKNASTRKPSPVLSSSSSGDPVPSMAQANAATPHLPPFAATTPTDLAFTQPAGKLAKFLGAEKKKKTSPQSSLAMRTINSTASEEYASDGLPSHPRPPHPMFRSLHEDSDGSDGR